MKKRTNKQRGLHAITNPDEIIMSIDEFPFKTELTFEPLIDHWRNKASAEGSISSAQLDLLEDRLARAPELLGNIEDLSLLDKYRDTLEMMIAPFFPVHSWSLELKALGRLFSDRFFYTSPRFEKVIGPKETFILKEEDQDKRNLTFFWRLLYAYRFIISKFYGISLVIDQPMIYTIPHRETGLDHYYKLNSYPPFPRLENLKPLPDLKDEDFEYLVDNFHNMDLWMEYFPPENFVFSGFTLHSFVDVTVEEATARLEHTLLLNRGNISDESFGQMERELRILFRLPDIRLGLAAIQGDGALNLTSRKKSWNSLMFRQAAGITPEDIDRSIYGKVIRGGQSMIIEDIGQLDRTTRLESKLLELGVRNIILAPLIYQGRQVGILEITSPNAGDIHPLSSYKLKKVIQFFARAVHEHRERFESRVQRVVKENYTAIHPAVEWRFREAAIRDLDRQQAVGPAEPEPIFFEEVFPLYAAADIRGSSHQRNMSIRDDLMEHLNLARDLLKQVNQSISLSIIDKLDHTLHKKVREIGNGMSPGDESSAIDFILREVNPLFRHLQYTYPELQPLLQNFMTQTQSGTELLYKKRKAYESSLRAINETIAGHLLREQQHLQKIFPHYFEKYETDGVEYNIYIGSSLVKDREFAPVYLHNLRLHQLISACEIARKIHRLQPELEEPLAITQLILVHSSPLNIRFRMEEKQFDVDGAYNVRYEIMKKRIDKAVVKGTGERITQPDRIAIIYSMEKELVEYRGYIEYLQEKGYFKDEPEYLEVEELQGVQGLKAIRLAVDLKGAAGSGPDTEDTLEVVRKIGER